MLVYRNAFEGELFTKKVISDNPGKGVMVESNIKDIF